MPPTSTQLTAAYPLHIGAVHPNIMLVEKAMKTDELRGLHLDFAVAAITGFFTQVIMQHDASLRPAYVETIPSEVRWEPRTNREQAESALQAISGRPAPSGVDLTDALRSAVIERIGTECFIPIYEK